MLFKIEDNIWFDNNKMLILRGNYSEDKYEEYISESPDIKIKNRFNEKWRPTITYLSAVNCNLKCSYCYADEGTYGDHHKKKYFTAETYIETFDHFYKMFDGIKAVSFFGGEPLLNYKHIKKFVEYIHNNYPKECIPEFGINTNGTIINSDIKEFLDKYKISMGTSLDGNKSLNDFNRKGDGIPSVYDKVVDTLNYLEDLDVHKIIQFTLTKVHVDEYEPGKLKKWLSELEKLNIEAYEIIPVTSNNKELKIDISDEKVLTKFKSMCEEMADYYLGKIASGKAEKVPRMFVGILMRIIQREYHQDCSAGYSFTITPDKIIYPCHCFSDKKEFALDFSELLTKNDFMNNKRFYEARLATREQVSECKECIAKNVCGAWCKGLTFVETGSLESVLEARCIMVKILVEKIVKFLVSEYPKNKENIRNNIIKYNNNALRRII
ncbi:radical SAM protein [Hathewaya histolytica]|uniref:Radical SAM protein n=1 Tax=Hathewaya histolytica TaxID=1498 RepID=A0A4U9RNB7_HATHI|nr:radical SAM protein [Hathewaya histolytica]VTQ93702.1 radical SAM protein [Hathewaya histolytica]